MRKKQPKTEIINFRVTQEVKDIIKAQAEKQNLSTGEFIRQMFRKENLL